MERRNDEADGRLRVEVRLNGSLRQDWQEWFDGFSLRRESSTTVLAGSVTDQSALFGLISSVRDLNLELISIDTLVRKGERMDAKDVMEAGAAGAGSKGFYRAGALAAVLVVAVGLLDFVLTLPQSGAQAPGTSRALDWFMMLHRQTLFALRSLGLLNLVTLFLGVPIYLSLAYVHQDARTGKSPWAVLATALFLIGAAVYFSSNSVLSLLSLSSQFAAATSEAARSQLLASGSALLARGEDLTAGTFIGFFLPEIAGLLMAGLMLGSRTFGRVMAIVGMLGMGSMAIFSTWAAFAPATYGTAMLIAMPGAVFSMTWYVLIARRLFLFARGRAANGSAVLLAGSR